MKKIYLVLLVVSLIPGISKLSAQNIWSGPVTTFTKENFADWTLSENQDRITNNVWLTRANTMGIFNIATETAFTKNSSPADTEWAFGTTADIGSLTFQDWQTAVESNPPGMVDRDMVLHLIADDIYIDIKFTSWSVGASGGGFSYERTTDNATNITETDREIKLTLYPNPAKDYARVFGLSRATAYRVFNILGDVEMKGMASEKEKINVQSLSTGIYFLRFENGQIIKFRKE